MQITDTAAIVTGGASGLGAATAAALAAGGARVFAFDLPASIEGAPQVDGVEYVAVDVTDPEQVQAAVDTAAGAGFFGKYLGYMGTNLSPALLGVGYIVGLNIGIVVLSGSNPPGQP